ncbi:MAG: AMP-binding protein [Amphritea sp.]
MNTTATASVNTMHIPQALNEKALNEKPLNEQALNPQGYQSILEVFDRAFRQFSQNTAFSCMGHSLSYARLDKLSRDFAAYLQQHTGLVPGDRIAVQLPNILQYPVVVLGALRAGLVVVNTNPLYTPRELQHQFCDAGVKALVVLDHLAAEAEKVVEKTDIQQLIITRIADLHGPIKRPLINAVAKHLKKMIPAYDLPQAQSLRSVLKAGARSTYTPVTAQPIDLAVLQYTGGTTGVAKGAMLTHANLVSNMLQLQASLGEDMKDGEEVCIAPLPLYHVYAFTLHLLLISSKGGHSVLIPNPRDQPGLLNTLKKQRFSMFVGLNTLFVSLCQNHQFKRLDFSALKLTASGGMALTRDAAERWEKVTGCSVCEGYGLTECSPVVSMNPLSAIQLGSIGLPVPGTEVKTIDAKGAEVNRGEPGELCVRGPQVMAGYWQRPEATEEMIDKDGWLKTGDIAVIQEDGYIRIVDREKDMIVVSGFNVYPNEIEDIVVTHPDIVECAVVGVPNEKTGEAVKVFAVASNPALNISDLRSYCREMLTPYKLPVSLELRAELPKSNVGKVLRRELRDELREELPEEAREPS